MIDDHARSAPRWIVKARQAPLALILIVTVAALLAVTDGITQSVSETQGVVTATEAADGVIPSLAPQEDTSEALDTAQSVGLVSAPDAAIAR